ncbi:MAG: class I SAM-dependent methyltransferase [Gemmatimonadota bacterium]|nr:class I SAM-dependent methyltransferase [Gemmatimonadota bacterium]
MDDLSDIREFYNAGWDAEDERLTRHQLEADLTWRYLDLYLPPQGRLLEVGFGTGSYTFALARRGYRMTSVDLAEEFAVRCKVRAESLGLADRTDFRTGDARTLEGVPRGGFDAVLLMGPLYHLVAETDRAMAVGSAFERLRPGGVVFSTMLSRFGIIGDLIRKNPAWIENQEEVRSMISNGYRPDDAPRGGFRGYFVRYEEVAPLHERAGFHTLNIAGVEPAIASDDESYNRLKGEQRELWRNLLFEISEEQSIVASSRHILYIGQKPAD